MTTKELLAVVAERGLEVVLLDSGVPALRGPNVKSEASKKLLRVLKLPAHRDAILARLRPVAPRSFLWRYGQTCTELPGDVSFGKPDRFPAGAWWWRRPGEPWQPVPGTPGVTTPPPATETSDE